MKSNSRKRKIIIIVTWVLFLFVLNGLFSLMEKKIYDTTAKKELVEQAKAVSRQLPSIVESDYYTQLAEIRVNVAKLKSLSFALQSYESIEPATQLLDEFYDVAEISGLFIYDRDGKILYSKGEDRNNIYYEGSPDVVTAILDNDIYKIIEDQMEYNNEQLGYLLSIQDSSVGNDNYFWGVGTRWLISIENSESSSQEYVQNYLARNRVLQSIAIGRTGFLMILNKETGEIVSSPFSQQDLKHIQNLNIKVDSDITSIDQLIDLFKDEEDTVRMEILGTDYYVYNLDVGNVVILVSLPLKEIQQDVSMYALVLIILVTLITGIAVLYAVFHTDDCSDTDNEYKGRFRWNRAMSGKMKIISALCVIGVYVGVIYLESLSVYAETFDYSRSKVEEVVQMLDEDDMAFENLQGWCDDEVLTRCRIAKCVLKYENPSNVDWQYVSDLADCLGVNYIYLFDRDGKVVITNSPFDQITIGPGSEMYPLLEGKPELVLAPEEDSLSGIYLQNAGVSVKDEENRSNGFVMVSLYPEELMEIRENLGFEYIFDQLGLTDGSYVVAVDDTDMKIDFIACMQDDNLVTDIAAFDYIGMKITDLGIKESFLRDNFNGNVLLFDNTYFASIRRVDDTYYIVMRPRVGLELRNTLPAIVAMVLTMLFTSLLVVLSSIGNMPVMQENVEQSQEPAPENADKEHKDGDFISMLGRMIYKNKPYFEDRWPNEIKKWRDRTPEEKFSTAAKDVLLIGLASIFILAKAAGKRSIWYYCITGKWESGINLYSITSCIISICLLIVIKILIHKLLFLTARASSAHGETICHLTDNFSGYALVIVGVFVCLHHFGVNTTALSLTGGVAGVIFGIGCQNIVADILAGVIMAFGGEVHVGDFVYYNGQYGVVLSIGVRTTKLKWFGQVTTVRNNEFKNYSFLTSKEQNRIIASLNIDLKESLERVEAILEKELPGIQQRISEQIGDPVNGPVYRGVQSISQDCLTLSFFVFVKGMYLAQVGRMLNGELKKMCERNDINLAMHQVVVNPPKDYPEAANPEQNEVTDEQD